MNRKIQESGKKRANTPEEHGHGHGTLVTTVIRTLLSTQIADHWLSDDVPATHECLLNTIAIIVISVQLLYCSTRTLLA